MAREVDKETETECPQQEDKVYGANGRVLGTVVHCDRDTLDSPLCSH